MTLEARGRRRPPGMAIDPRMRQRRVEVQRAMGRRRLRALLAGLTVAALGAAGLGVLHSPLLGARHVSVAGVGGAQASAILAAAGVLRGEPLVDISPGAAAARAQRRLAWVSTVQVTRSWPDSLRVAVTVRHAVAQVALGATGATVDLVDVTGRVVARSAHHVVGLPLLTGAGAAGAPGSWLGGGQAALGTPSGQPVAAALELAAGTRSLGSALTSITVSGGGLLSVVLAPGVTVTLGPDTQLAAKIAALLTVAREVDLNGVTRVDLSVPGRPTVASAAAQG